MNYEQRLLKRLLEAQRSGNQELAAELRAKLALNDRYQDRAPLLRRAR